MLLLLAHSNRGTKQKKAFKGGNFREFWECPIQRFLSLLDFWLHVTCLKMSLLQFKFLWQSGTDPPFKKKVKPNEEEAKGKKEKKKRKRNQNVVQQKAHLNVHRAVFRMHGSVNLADLSLTRKTKFVWCVCVCVCEWFCEKIGFQSLYPWEFF